VFDVRILFRGEVADQIIISAKTIKYHTRDVRTCCMYEIYN